jgi:hypothetical protein
VTYQLGVGEIIEARNSEIEVRGNIAGRAGDIEQLNRLADKLGRTRNTISAAELSRHLALPVLVLGIANGLRV